MIMRKIKLQQVCIWLVLYCNYCTTMHGINSAKFVNLQSGENVVCYRQRQVLVKVM